MNIRNLLPIIVLCFLAGCAKYTASPLTALRHQLPHESTRKNNCIYLTHRALTKKETKTYLGRNIDKKIQAVQVYITNTTRRELIIKSSSMEPTCLDVQSIKDSTYFSPTMRVCAYGLPALGLGVFVAWPFAFLAVPAVVDSLWAEDANELLEADYDEKCIERKIIHPDSTVNGIIFINKELFNDQIMVTLIDRDTQEQITISSSKTSEWKIS